MKTGRINKKHLSRLARFMLADPHVSIIVQDFHGVDWHKQCRTFPIFTVYKNPKDFHDKYVVRLFDGQKPRRLISVSDTLDEARKTIPPMYLRTPRTVTDDPVIVESWI